MGAAISIGLVWLLVPLLFLPFLSGDDRTFVIVIIIGRTAAATFTTSLPAIWLAVIPTPIALILVLLWQSSASSSLARAPYGTLCPPHLADGKNFQSGDHLLPQSYTFLYVMKSEKLTS